MLRPQQAGLLCAARQFKRKTPWPACPDRSVCRCAPIRSVRKCACAAKPKPAALSDNFALLRGRRVSRHAAAVVAAMGGGLLSIGLCGSGLPKLLSIVPAQHYAAKRGTRPKGWFTTSRARETEAGIRGRACCPPSRCEPHGDGQRRPRGSARARCPACGGCVPAGKTA